MINVLSQGTKRTRLEPEEMKISFHVTNYVWTEPRAGLINGHIHYQPAGQEAHE